MQDVVAQHSFHTWFVLITTLLAIVSFVREKIPIEVTSIVILTVLLLFGQFFPILSGEMGRNALSADALLSGFSNSSLIAVLALLVMGQAMIHTDALRLLTAAFAATDKKFAWLSIGTIIVFVMVVSAFLNNTPLVVIAIPFLQMVASSANISESKVMIPLSYAAILGDDPRSCWQSEGICRGAGYLCG